LINGEEQVFSEQIFNRNICKLKIIRFSNRVFLTPSEMLRDFKKKINIALADGLRMNRVF
jgi:hypothetical protein